MTSQLVALRNHRFQNGVLACILIGTRTVQACTRKAARSKWWLLLTIGVGMLLTVVALKLVALFGAAVHVSFLRDVGQNVDLPAAAGGGGAGLGAWLGQPGGKDPSGGPIGFMWFVPVIGDQFLHSGPSTDSPTTITNPPMGARLTYNDVRYDASGNPTWYRLTPPAATPGWAPASDLSSTRPVEPHYTSVKVPDTSGKVVSGTGAQGGARG